MGWNGTWKTKGRPSEARLKFFDETFLQKSFDLALDLHRRAAQERKLGKQRSVFPGRWGTRKVAARSPLRPPLEGTSPKGGGETKFSVNFWLRTYLAPPLGAATSRWDVAQRPVSAAASVGAGRLPLADSTRGGSRDAGTAAAVTERVNPSCPRAEDKKSDKLSKNPGNMRAPQFVP